MIEEEVNVKRIPLRAKARKPNSVKANEGVRDVTRIVKLTNTGES
jgi:hypothetical protein